MAIEGIFYVHAKVADLERAEVLSEVGILI